MGKPGLRLPQFRRFGSRLLLLIVGLIAFAQLSDYLLVASASRRNAVERINENLGQGTLLFERRVNARMDELSGRAALMSDDYSIRQLFLRDQPDPATVRSALRSYSVRMGVPFMALLGPDGAEIGDTGGDLPTAALAPFQALMRTAAAADDPRANGFARLPDGPAGKLYALLVVPIYAPKPEIVAWIGLALPIDHKFATELKADAQLEVTFYYGATGAMLPVESTLPESSTRSIAPVSPGEGIRNVSVGGEPYVTAYRPLLPLITPGHAAIALQRSLEDELAPSLILERFLLILLLASIVVACLVAPMFARNLSRPLRALAEHTRVIGRGDYGRRLELGRADEIGELAASFNKMSEGLAERDRVRDLLDKNVSPEIAAQMMRDGGVLGGEEREVTVLFVDLRSFTRLSEMMAPRDVLALLNRYFDRMSGIVEIYHGVVDKYIGDEIMAIFGAPVAFPNHADCAILAALDMQAALARLNGELLTEGRSKLAFGIGINTARIIAGNIGSSRRLNYSVIGDGVNVAARLEDLTRMSQFRADILVSGATLAAAKGSYRTRPLGAAPVRGRDEPVEVFAVEGRA